MEHCNACNTDVEDVEAHVKSPEHIKNLEKLRSKFQSKVYRPSKRGVDI